MRVRVLVRAAALFCPRAEKLGRETGPAAMNSEWLDTFGLLRAAETVASAALDASVTLPTIGAVP